jgi:hypothetical protein
MKKRLLGKRSCSDSLHKKAGYPRLLRTGAALVHERHWLRSLRAADVRAGLGTSSESLALRIYRAHTAMVCRLPGSPAIGRLSLDRLRYASTAAIIARYHDPKLSRSSGRAACRCNDGRQRPTKESSRAQHQHGAAVFVTTVTDLLRAAQC